MVFSIQLEDNIGYNSMILMVLAIHLRGNGLILLEAECESYFSFSYGTKFTQTKRQIVVLLAQPVFPSMLGVLFVVGLYASFRCKWFATCLMSVRYVCSGVLNDGMCGTETLIGQSSYSHFSYRPFVLDRFFVGSG